MSVTFLALWNTLKAPQGLQGINLADVHTAGQARLGPHQFPYNSLDFF